jgi:hypothetical protein
MFYCVKFETPQPRGPGSRIYFPHEEGGLVIPPGIGCQGRTTVPVIFSTSRRELPENAVYSSSIVSMTRCLPTADVSIIV